MRISRVAVRPEDVLGLGRVLHAGQLDDDAVGALLLDHRLGDAEFVDPVVQGGDVLLEREFADLQLACGFSVATSLRSLPSPWSVSSRSGWLSAMAARALSRVSASRKRMTSARLHGHAAVAQVLVAQHGAQVGRGRVEALGQRALHVDLQQEVHAATQVEAEVHRQRMQRGQPLRRAASRFRATTYCGSAGSGLKAFPGSLAFSWVSVSLSGS
jgi:hypothetical protein